VSSHCGDHLEGSQSDQSGPTVGAGRSEIRRDCLVDRFVAPSAGILQRILQY
jgi:hypothetical protein